MRSETNMDRLEAAVASRGPLCLGLDTRPEHLPPGLLARASGPAEAVLAYNEALIEAAGGLVACCKLQIACYEALGLPGLRAYAATLGLLRRRGILAIADIKRGDIADTAALYARAHLEGELEADFATLSPYLGMDSLEPWLELAERRGKGLFALARTSNPGWRDFEGLELAGGGRVFEAVADRIAAVRDRGRGRGGYGALGAVVGCTERAEAQALRRRLGGVFLLIPGYGAQGGSAEDAALLLEGGRGGVVNASRSILRAWALAPGAAGEGPGPSLEEAAEAAREATLAFGDAMRDAIRAGKGGEAGGGAAPGSPS